MPDPIFKVSNVVVHSINSVYSALIDADTSYDWNNAMNDFWRMINEQRYKLKSENNYYADYMFINACRVVAYIQQAKISKSLPVSERAAFAEHDNISRVNKISSDLDDVESMISTITDEYTKAIVETEAENRILTIIRAISLMDRDVLKIFVV